MKNRTVPDPRPNDLGQHQLRRRGDFDGPLQCFIPNVQAVHRNPPRRRANITVTPFYAMDGSVFALVLVDDQVTIIAGVRDIDDSDSYESDISDLVAAFHLVFEKLPHSSVCMCGWECMRCLAADFRLVQQSCKHVLLL